jgi:RNA polymerase sigma factor (sigma-70 family)
MSTAPLGIVLRHVRTMAEAESARKDAAQADGQLLKRFVMQRDEGAFALLLRRHGPMVLGVCRRVLPRLHDAEDVFQATFLLLARKAGSIRKRGSVGSWLHGVAFRLALAGKAQAACRQAHERRAATMPKVEDCGDDRWEDLQAILDEGLLQLPERYRTALVLAYLEGKTHEEAAGQLGCPLATFRNWVARGRRLLRQRLVRRGLALSAGALGMVLIRNAAPAAVPAALLHPTLRSALQFAAGTRATAVVAAPVAAMVESGLKAMLVARLRLGAMLLLTFGIVTAGAGLGAQRALFARGDDEKQVKPAQPPADQTQGRLEQVRTDRYGDPLPQGAIKREGTLRFRLGGGQMTDLFLGAEGKTLISNTLHGPRAVQVWDAATGKRLQSFPGDFGYQPIAVTTDGSLLAIPEGARIVLWNLYSGKQVRRLEADDVTAVHALAFSPDGQMLASGDANGIIHFWYVATGQRSAQIATGKMEDIASLAYSPAGKVLAAGDQWGRSIQLWDAASHRLLYQIARPGSTMGTMAFSPDGALIAMGAADTPVGLWDARTGRQVRPLPGSPLADAFAFSPDGKTLATNEVGEHQYRRAINLWRVADGKHLRRIATHPYLPADLVFSPDGKILFAGSQGAIAPYDLSTGKLVGPAPESPVSVRNLMPASRRNVLACIKDFKLQLHDLSTGRYVQLNQGCDALALSADGGQIVSVADNQICLWETASQKLVRRLAPSAPRSKQWRQAVALSPDGKALAVLRSDGVVELWDAGRGQQLRELDFRGNNRSFRPMNNRHDSGSVAFSPDGALLAAAGTCSTGEARVRIWDVAGWSQLPQLTVAMNAPTAEQPKQVFSGLFSGSWEPNITPQLAFAPDGRTLALNRWQKTIPVWEVASGKRRLLLQGHEESTVWIAYSPDSRTLASASWDNTIRLWDLETGEELRSLTGHRGRANSLAFTADGNTLVSAGDDSTLLYWDVAAQTHRPLVPSEPLSTRQLESHWNDLAAADADKGYQAVVSLSSSPAEAITLLARHLKPATSPPPDRVDSLVAALDSTGFALRSKATAALEELDDLAVAALKKKLAENHSPEVRQRIRTILKSAEPGRSPALLRQSRAVEVLEKIGTPPARQILQKLAAGAPAARLTKEAAAALARLGKG